MARLVGMVLTWRRPTGIIAAKHVALVELAQQG
jgi:hypothetical protein